MSHDTDFHHLPAAGAGERRESFTAHGPVTAIVATRSGDIVVTPSGGDAITVRLRATGSSASSLLEQCEVRFDEATATLHVVSPAASLDGSPFSLTRGLRRSLFGAGVRDVDVEVGVPSGSAVEVRSASGDCVVRGEFGATQATTASGDVAVGDGTTVEVRSASGDVRVDRARESLTVRTASGDVSVGEAGAASKVESASGDVSVRATGEVTEVSTASGDVSISATKGGRLSARSASGDVRISVGPGLEIDVVANSVSGDLSSAIPLSADAAGRTGSGDTLQLKVNTVSGDVTIGRG